MSTRLVSGGPHSACQADGRCKSADTKAACLQFLYGMVLEWKELPCKSADGAPFNSKFRRPRDAGWRKEGMVQPWRTFGTVVAHTVSGPVPTVLNDLPTADDRTSVDGHTSPGPKRPVRYIASLRETGEWVLAESAKQRV